jgi:glycine betaine/choline ABC-type transport system substrate-binding protein
MGTRVWGRAVVAMLTMLCIAGSIAACGGSDSAGGGSTSADATPFEVTMSVHPEGSPEEHILDEIYAQALKAAGYKVKRATNPSFGVSADLEAVKLGQTSGYPVHLSTALNSPLGVEIEDLPSNADAAYRQAKNGFEKQGLTAFPPTPFGIANAVGMLRKTAEERGLATDSDLKGQAEEMTIKAPTYCHVSIECLGGIEAYYDTAFAGVSYERDLSSALSWLRPEPAYLYKVLEDGESDASMLFTTDGRLAADKDKFVILEDDKHLFPAGNVIWVTSPEVVEEAGPKYEKTIVAVQKGLTLPVMQKLNARVELEKQSPAKAAAAYLKEVGYTG